MRCLPLLLIAGLSTSAQAGVYVRHNAAGYPPRREIRLVVMSSEDLAGERWSVRRGDELLVVGRFRTISIGRGAHTPLPFNYEVTLPAGLAGEGDYRFSADGTSVELSVRSDPYSRFLQEPLVHLRRMRSGADVPPPRRPSHLGDAEAPVWVPDGDPAEGRWKVDPSGRFVDVAGGWYDAGDQIKFTLNIAYTTYHLLLAYDLSPALFENHPGEEGLPQIIAEARQGLEWLTKVHPDPNTFVIQVGDERDHEQPLRLPEDDALDGHRPALCALSRVHMASASAALAMGARVWELRGDLENAARYRSAAVRIFERLQKPDTVLTAFERGKVNDFYRDTSEADQVALAAVQLYRLTHRPEYLEIAREAAPPAVDEPSWAAWNWSANYALLRLGEDRAAGRRLYEETGGYVRHAAERGQPWGLPTPYVWGSLHRWTEAAIAARLTAIEMGPCRDRDALFDDVVDYLFGRNNWGVSFLFTEQLPNSVRHIYSPAYRLLGLFPTGALSEGPGDRAGHDGLNAYFEIPPDDPFHYFNTQAGVFFDSSSDFMCQESTINGQADAVLLLTLAVLKN